MCDVVQEWRFLLFQSLPASLDEAVSITENNLGDQQDRLRRGANAATSHIGHFHYESGDSSADDLASGGESSSSENILEEDHHAHHPQQHHLQAHPPAQLGHHHHSFHSVTLSLEVSKGVIGSWHPVSPAGHSRVNTVEVRHCSHF